MPTVWEPKPSADQMRWFRDEVYPYDGRLKAYLHTAYPSVRDVEDVVQESYVRIWRARATCRIERAGAFLFQVARNVALDILRHDRVAPAREVTDSAVSRVLDERQSADEDACSHEEIELLDLAIRSLPARCREVVVLRKLRCMSQKEIAQRLGISEQTVEVQVVRGVKRIREFLLRRGVRGEKCG